MFLLLSVYFIKDAFFSICLSQGGSWENVPLGSPAMESVTDQGPSSKHWTPSSLGPGATPSHELCPGNG